MTFTTRVERVSVTAVRLTGPGAPSSFPSGQIPTLERFPAKLRDDVVSRLFAEAARAKNNIFSRVALPRLRRFGSASFSSPPSSYGPLSFVFMAATCSRRTAPSSTFPLVGFLFVQLRVPPADRVSPPFNLLFEVRIPPLFKPFFSAKTETKCLPSLPFPSPLLLPATRRARTQNRRRRSRQQHFARSVGRSLPPLR